MVSGSPLGPGLKTLLLLIHNKPPLRFRPSLNDTSPDLSPTADNLLVGDVSQRLTSIFLNNPHIYFLLGSSAVPNLSDSIVTSNNLHQMTVAVNFSFSSSIPPWTIHTSHSPQRNTSQRATASSPITIPTSNSSPQQTITRRCECYDMYKQTVPFAEAWSWQKSVLEHRKTLIDNNEDGSDESDTLIMLQHQPVYTLGTASSETHLNFDIKDPPLPLFQTERGGEVTYHGPGQLVMYPIMNLRFHKMDLHWYLRSLEEVVIRVLSSVFMLKASRVNGLTGVWVGDKKVAAIGIRVTRWVTYHGLALNVCTDLSPFDRIVPCGIKDRGVGSIKGLLSDCCSVDDDDDDGKLIDVAHESLLKEFCEVFQVELCHQPVSSLLEFSNTRQ
ncbi:hypothetical protein QVD17_10455 [Tagetes erecta]|uniref:lipoyl(octanoyl) transferase n=1 Tax=Tagetes erecta TaxID=13708 RepID=A0AAD8L157_TARER|nr:hypothetical protein QVD17_10455 [Tagetes erecta]